MQSVDKTTNQQPLFLGIDGGGTKCRARIERADGTLLGEGIGGPANIVRGISETTNSILQATYRALSQANLPMDTVSELHAGLGIAGAGVENYRKQLAQWQHPFKQFNLTTDMHIACLGAHDYKDGATMIAGTGFCAGVISQGKYIELGGYGLTLGDGCSGARIGLAAIRYCLEALDGIASMCPLVHAVTEKVGYSEPNKIVEHTIQATPAQFASFAPLVFEHGKMNDPVALKILQETAKYIDLYADRLMHFAPERLSFIGGIAEAITPYLTQNVKDRLCVPIHSPQKGAIYLAKQSCI